VRLFPLSIKGQQLRLDPTVYHHVMTVRRLRVGDPVEWVDNQQINQGRLANALPPDTIEVTQVSQRQALVGGPHWTVIQAIPKGDKMGDIIRGLGELGVHTIIPTISARCVSQGGDHKVERWQRIAESAAMQAHLPHIPTIQPIQPLHTVLATPYSQTRYICWESATPTLSGPTQLAHDITLVIGPEGGFDEKEVTLATSYGYSVLSLGATVLRVERAGLVAVAMLTGWLAHAGFLPNQASSR